MGFTSPGRIIAKIARRWVISKGYSKILALGDLVIPAKAGMTTKEVIEALIIMRLPGIASPRANIHVPSGNAIGGLKVQVQHL